MKIAVIFHSETGNTKRMAELIKEGCEKIQEVDVKTMSIDELDKDFINEAKSVLFGSPTYEGVMSWQMKKLMDTIDVELKGKLGGVFASQNWPGGGGADLAEMSMIAGMLIRGMLIYSGGISEGYPAIHFGAVSTKSPEGVDEERCLKLGENIAKKAKEIFK